MKNSEKPTVLEPGYINIYSDLSYKERRQVKYKSLYKKETPNWDESQVYLAKQFGLMVPNSSIILDAGCGNGNYVIDENHTKIEKAIGIDVKQEFTAKNISMDEIVYCNLENIPFSDNTFDAVVSLWVVEHLENPQSVFSEIYRVLKPNGLLFFVTPNKSYLPIIAINILKSRLINSTLNRILFGRKSNDIFPTYYNANTLRDIAKIIDRSFKIEYLSLNFDPSYTSFNSLTYKLTKALNKILPSMFWSSHIIGILRKI